MEHELIKTKIINQYVHKVIQEWPKWSKGKDIRSGRGYTLHKIISEIHTAQGIPQTLFSSSTEPNGQFDIKSWTLIINKNLVEQIELKKEEFISIAETFYLGGCYVEHAWLTVIKALYPKRKEVAGRFTIPTSDLQEVGRKLSIRPAILAKASESACKIPKNAFLETNDHFKIEYVQSILHKALTHGLNSPSTITTPAINIQTPKVKPTPIPPPLPKKNPTPQPPIVPTQKQIPTPNIPKPPKADPILKPKVPLGNIPSSMPPSLAMLFTPQPTTPTENPFPKIVKDPNAYVVWPKYTMVNPIILNDYIFQVVWECWEDWKKGKGSVSNRARKLHDILSIIHKRCGIPETTFKETNNSGGTNGSFGAASWSITINKYRVSRLILEPKNFLGIAETVYHEGRHAEQAWLVAVERFFQIRVKNSEGIYIIPNHLFQETERRYFSYGIKVDVLKKAAEVACQRPKIPKNLAGEALKHRRNFVHMIQKLYDIWWGPKRHEADVIMKNLHISPNGVAYEKYLNLPYEHDAHAIQMVIRGLHKRMGDFDAWATEEYLKKIPAHFKPFF